MIQNFKLSLSEFVKFYARFSTKIVTTLSESFNKDSESFRNIVLG